MAHGPEDGDHTVSVHDPCVGTGRTLLSASNWSLRLSGQDLDGTVLKGCRINLWLYAPWGMFPLPDECYEGVSG